VDRVPVASQALASVGYEPASAVLEVQFTSGGLYRYYGVPAEVHRELMEAGSRGHYFAERIRDRYRYRRLASGQRRSSV
jgi:KTSC domain